jgi:hypothetical protein
MGTEGGEADPQSELRPVFIPALVALLTAAEEKAGRRLHRQEVERLTSEGICMMMTHAEAKHLERSRPASMGCEAPRASAANGFGSRSPPKSP